MRVALSQINTTLGDFSGNGEKILSEIERAREKRCDLIVFPELTLFGYHPCDLLERESIVDAQLKVMKDVVRKIPKDIACLFGAVTKNQDRGKPYFNSAIFVEKGKIKQTLNKQLLPVYDVFDDSRHFKAGSMAENFIEWKGKKIFALVCEDMWGWDPIHRVNPIADMAPGCCDLIVNLSASPFTLEKRGQRNEFASKTAKHLAAPIVYVNMVGGQDELVFDGGSFALDSSGQTICQSSYFHEDLNLVDLETKEGGTREAPERDVEFIHQTLVLGIRDFSKKTGLQKIHLGLSGGIDSAVVVCLAADAVGPQNVTAIALPSQFNHPESALLAEKLASNLGCEYHQINIQEGFDVLTKSYEETFGGKEFGLMHENIQARLRGLFLMAYANEHNSLLLTTGNKSEYATGYATLYGDMCGGLAPIADLLKEQVYDLAHYYNSEHELIPTRIIDREPSAELRPNQKDSDSLPEYHKLDAAVDKLVCNRQKAKGEMESWVLNRLMLSEFKRWQAAPILKVSQHAFGQGRRMPIAHKARV